MTTTVQGDANYTDNTTRNSAIGNQWFRRQLMELKTIGTAIAWLSVVIVVLGLVFNILIVKVLKKRNSLGTRLLLYLAFVDIAILVALFFMNVFPDLIPSDTTPYIWVVIQCLEPFVMPVLKTLYTLKAYLMVITGFQRSLILAVSVKYIRFTKDRVFNRALIGIAILSVVFNIPYWIKLRPQTYWHYDLNATFIKPYYGPSDELFLKVYNYLDLSVNNILPVIGIVICDVIMIISRVRSSPETVHAAHIRGKNHLTNIVVVMTTVSMALHVLGALYQKIISPTMGFISIQKMKYVFQVFILIHSSINFLIYCAFGPEFRKTLRDVF